MIRTILTFMTRSSPHGPFALTARRQVTVPKALLDRLGLGPDDRVQFLFDDAANEIVLVPDSRVQAWVAAASADAPSPGLRGGHRG